MYYYHHEIQSLQVRVPVLKAAWLGKLLATVIIKLIILAMFCIQNDPLHCIMTTLLRRNS